MQTETPTTRARAGKALIIFLAAMALLTMLSNTLQNMVVPVVTPALPQRGALEQQIDASGELNAASLLPVVVPASARVQEVYVKEGAKVSAGDPLMLLDYTDTLAERHKALLEALDTASEKQQAYDWAVADISRDSVSTLKSRRKSLQTAEAKRDAAQQALDELIAAEAGESELKRARSALKSAQETVDYRKRYLEQYETTRDYMKTGKELETAKESLSAAARAYYDALGYLDGAEAIDRDAQVASALRTVQFTGSARKAIPFNPDEPHLSTVRAIADGELTAVEVSAGEIAPTDKPSMTLGATRAGLSLTVTVGKDDADIMEVGDVAQIDIGDDRLECAIISKRVSAEDADSYEIEFAIPQGYGSIGLRASMKYRKRTQNYDLLIPLNALRHDNDGDFVYIVEQQDSSLGSSMRVKRASVYVLEKDNTRAALQGGISQREMLVLRSDRDIQDGDRVRLEED